MTIIATTETSMITSQGTSLIIDPISFFNIFKLCGALNIVAPNQPGPRTAKVLPLQIV